MDQPVGQPSDEEDLQASGTESPQGASADSEDSDNQLSPHKHLPRKLTTESLTRVPGPISPTSEAAAASGTGNLKDKMALLQARRSTHSAGSSKFEGLEGVKLADRIQGLSASLSAAPSLSCTPSDFCFE